MNKIHVSFTYSIKQTRSRFSEIYASDNIFLQALIFQNFWFWTKLIKHPFCFDITVWFSPNLKKNNLTLM